MNNLTQYYAFNGLLENLITGQEISFIYQINTQNNKLNFDFQIKGKALGGNLDYVKELSEQLKKIFIRY